MNADAEVMRYYPAVLDRAESDASVDRIEMAFDTEGFGVWAVEVLGVAPFVGYVGLARAEFEAPFTPAVEIGWRLARAYWGQGYASEAASAVLAFGFDRLGLDGIVSFTSHPNLPSQQVMRRIGMHRDPADDFDHPAVPPGHRLRPHVLYRLSKAEWSDGVFRAEPGKRVGVGR